MRHRRDEVLAHRLERALVREVAKCVDGAVCVADGGDREPELAVAELQGDALGTGGLVGARDGDESLDGRPAWKHFCRRPAEHLCLRQAGDPHRGAVPEAHPGVAVDQEDAVSDRCEHARCLCTRLELLVEPGVLDCVRRAAGELFGEIQILRPEALRGLGRRERDRAEHGVAALQRHADVRRKVDPEFRLAQPDHRGDIDVCESGLRRVARGDCQLGDRPVRLDEVDGARACDVGGCKHRDLSERLAEVA